MQLFNQNYRDNSKADFLAFRNRKREIDEAFNDDVPFLESELLEPANKAKRIAKQNMNYVLYPQVFKPWRADAQEREIEAAKTNLRQALHCLSNNDSRIKIRKDDLIPFDVTTHSGLKVPVFLVRQDKPTRKTRFFFHGNAGGIGTFLRERTPDAINALLKGCNIVTWTYPGYSNLEGVPTQRKMVEVSREVISYVTKKLGLNPKDSVFHGHSLGCGVLLNVAASEDLKGFPRKIVAHAPFHSVRSMAADVLKLPKLLMPQLRHLLLNYFNNSEAVKRISEFPKSDRPDFVFFHSPEDTIIKAKESVALSNEAKALGLNSRWLPLNQIKEHSGDLKDLPFKRFKT